MRWDGLIQLRPSSGRRRPAAAGRVQRGMRSPVFALPCRLAYPLAWRRFSPSQGQRCTRGRAPAAPGSRPKSAARQHGCVATERKDLLQSAVDVAQRAAERSGVDVRLIGSLAEIHAVHSLFDRIWQPEKNNPPVTVDQLRAMTYAGNYLAGAFDRGSLIGACVGFFAAPPGASMHSHVAGVAAEVRGRNVGFALKLHQRAWALGQGLTEVTWTFDPVVRRNAYFNLAKLGAIPHDYLVDFYGDMDDGINIGQGSDRLLVGWDLGSDAVVDACAGRSVGPDDSLAAAAPFALREVSGEPVVGDDPGTPDRSE